MTTIKGVWVFVEAPDWSYTPTEIYVSFTSNGSAYIGMTCGINPLDYMIAGGSTVCAHNGNRWADDAYRTVDFGKTEQEVPDDFYTWFTANATEKKMSSPVVGTLKEEVLKLRQNLDKVYEAGRIAGGGGGGGDYTQEELDQAVADATEQGKQAEQDEVWASIQQRLSQTGENLFAGCAWNDRTYNPKSAIVVEKGTAKTMYNNAQITSTKVPIELRVANADMMFASCGSLRTILYLGFFGVTSSGSLFAGDVNLEDITVGGTIQSSIGFAGCPKLTNASVQSIIDHLADLTGQTSLKITFHATVMGKMTTEQLETIWAKNWTTS